VIQDQKTCIRTNSRFKPPQAYVMGGVFPQCASLFDGSRITVYLFICILFDLVRLGLTIHCAGNVNCHVGLGVGMRP
jgi:hypothetical protein